MFLLQFSAASLVFPIGDLLFTADALLPRSKSVLQAKNIMIIFALQIRDRARELHNI